MSEQRSGDGTSTRGCEGSTDLFDHVFAPGARRCYCGGTGRLVRKVVFDRGASAPKPLAATQPTTPARGVEEAGIVEDVPTLLAEGEQLYERGERIIAGQIAQLKRMRKRLAFQQQRLERALAAIQQRRTADSGGHGQ